MSFQKWKSSDQSINIIDTKFKKNFDTVNILYEHSLKNLIIVLNQIHNLKEERRFWEILLGAWLSSFINQCHIEFIKKHKFRFIGFLILFLILITTLQVYKKYKLSYIDKNFNIYYKEYLLQNP